MKWLALAVAPAAAAAAAAAANACPCDDASLCEPITAGARQETFVFSVTNDNWRGWDWDQLTTVAVFDALSPSPILDDDLFCQAHAQDVRIVFGGSFPVANLSSAADRTAWVAEQVAIAEAQRWDGMNIDFESPVNATQAEWLTELAQETTDAFHKALPHSQVTLDVAWSPNDIDGRQFDAVGLAKATDFLFVMSYDLRSQVFEGPCIASANSPFDLVVQGYEDYLALGIPADKLVVGLPWYGYDYPCLSLDENSICSIESVPFRGANCSDAAGTEKNYAVVRQLALNNATAAGVSWNATLQAPFFEYEAVDGTMHQVWYDDPDSIGAKLDALSGKGFRGVGMWTVDSVDYSGTAVAEEETAAMWGALRGFSP